MFIGNVAIGFIFIFAIGQGSFNVAPGPILATLGICLFLTLIFACTIGIARYKEDVYVRTGVYFGVIIMAAITIGSIIVYFG